MKETCADCPSCGDVGFRDLPATSWRDVQRVICTCARGKDFAAACEHAWAHTGTGRHGSDKGVDHYHCPKCGSDKEE